MCEKDKKIEELEADLELYQSLCEIRKADLELYAHFINDIRNTLRQAEDAGDFCQWLAEQLGVEL